MLIEDQPFEHTLKNGHTYPGFVFVEFKKFIAKMKDNNVKSFFGVVEVDRGVDKIDFVFPLLEHEN